MSAPTSTLEMHVGLAEQGKLHALAGEHEEALAYYRQALQIAVSPKAPGPFFRHYTEATVESLEHTGADEEVLKYCKRVIDFYARADYEDEHKRTFANVDLALTDQRRAAVLLKLERAEEAEQALERALALAAEHDFVLPLSQRLSDWCSRRLSFDAQRITPEQVRSGYFSVRKDSVNPSRAIRMTAELRAALPSAR